MPGQSCLCILRLCTRAACEPSRSQQVTDLHKRLQCAARRAQHLKLQVPQRPLQAPLPSPRPGPAELLPQLGEARPAQQAPQQPQDPAAASSASWLWALAHHPQLALLQANVLCNRLLAQQAGVSVSVVTELSSSQGESAGRAQLSSAAAAMTARAACSRAQQMQSREGQPWSLPVAAAAAATVSGPASASASSCASRSPSTCPASPVGVSASVSPTKYDSLRPSLRRFCSASTPSTLARTTAAPPRASQSQSAQQPAALSRLAQKQTKSFRRDRL